MNVPNLLLSVPNVLLQEMLPFHEAIRRGGGGVQESSDAMLAYKFVINVHGNGNEWSNRLRMLLSSGAVVLKQEANAV